MLMRRHSYTVVIIDYLHIVLRGFAAAFRVSNVFSGSNAGMMIIISVLVANVSKLP